MLINRVADELVRNMLVPFFIDSEDYVRSDY
jgi:hypothetical protein